MNIVVLVKQVPAISDIKIDVKDNNLVRVGAPSMMNPVDMHAIEAAVAVKDAVGDANITIMTMGTALAGEIMHTLGCTYDEKQVGMFLWGRIPDIYSGSEELADKVLYEANVFLTPGFIFGSQGNRFIRISLCCNNQMLQEALTRIQKVIK